MTIIATPTGLLRAHFRADMEAREAETLYFGVLQDGRFAVASRSRCEIVTPDRRKALRIFLQHVRSQAARGTTQGLQGQGLQGQGLQADG